MDDPFADLFGPPKPNPAEISTRSTPQPMSEKDLQKPEAATALAPVVVPEPVSVVHMLKEDVRDYIAEAVSASVQDAMSKVIGSLRGVLEQVSGRVQAVEGEMRDLAAVVKTLSIEDVNATLNARFARVDEAIKDVSRSVQAMRDRAELMDATTELAKLTSQSSKKRCEDCLEAPAVARQAPPSAPAAPAQPEAPTVAAYKPEQFAQAPPAPAPQPQAPAQQQAPVLAPQVSAPPPELAASTTLAPNAPPPHAYQYGPPPPAQVFAQPAPMQPFPAAPPPQPVPSGQPPAQQQQQQHPQHPYAPQYAPPMQPQAPQAQQAPHAPQASQAPPQAYASYPPAAPPPAPYPAYLPPAPAPMTQMAPQRTSFPPSSAMPPPPPQQHTQQPRYNASPMPQRMPQAPQRVEGTSQMSTQQVVQDLCNMGFEKHSIEQVMAQMIRDRQNIDLNVIVDRLMNGGGR